MTTSGQTASKGMFAPAATECGSAIPKGGGVDPEQTSPIPWLEVATAIAELELLSSKRLPGVTHGLCPDCTGLLD